MTNSTTARLFLGLNALFSLICGLALLIVPGMIEKIMFVVPSGWTSLILLGLGVGLLVFSLDLAMMATNRFVKRFEVNLIVFADIGWIIASAVLIGWFAQGLLPAGIILVKIVAAIVALFAIGQFFGGRKILPPAPQISFRAKDGDLIARVTRKVNAAVPDVWKIMQDHPGYADVASNLTKVEVLSGDGLGMKRKCYGPKGESWQETCDHYVKDKAFGFRIHTDAPDYPYPFVELKGLWSVEPSGSGSEFAIELTARPKGNAITRALFAPIAKRRFTPVLIDLADVWAARMEKAA